MTAAWDRAEAMRVAERLEQAPTSGGMIVSEGALWIVQDAAALLRAADAEIARLRAEAEKG